MEILLSLDTSGLDTETYKQLVLSRKLWQCHQCKAMFPTSTPASADDGVTLCSMCVITRLSRTPQEDLFHRYTRAIDLLKELKSITSHSRYNGIRGDKFSDDFSELLIKNNALLDESYLYLSQPTRNPRP